MKSLEILYVYVFFKKTAYFSWIYKDGKSKLSKQTVERKHLRNRQKNQFLKVKNSPLELEKYFIELKDRKSEIKREIEELFFKPIIMSIDDMGKLEEREIKKINPIKNTWYDWLINYISKPITKTRLNK